MFESMCIYTMNQYFCHQYYVKEMRMRDGVHILLQQVPSEKYVGFQCGKC